VSGKGRMAMVGDDGSAAALAALWNGGAAALQAGCAAEAVAAFEALVAAEPASATAWMGLAMAHRRLKQPTRSLAALQTALALEPRNPRALLLSADHYAAAGDARAASAFYDAVLKVAEAEGVDDGFGPELDRARRRRAEFAAAYEGHLRDALGAGRLDG